MQEVLLECDSDCGFARGGEPGEPEGEAFLVAEDGAFRVGEGRGVPCYVAASEVRMYVDTGEGGRRTHVAMLSVGAGTKELV